MMHMHPQLCWMHCNDLVVILDLQEWAYVTPDANSKSDSMAMKSTAGTNMLVWESEICGTAEQALMPERN